MKLRPSLLAAVAALCIAAGAVRAQYVEDSIDVGGSGVGSLAYNSREDVLYGADYYGGFFAISCDSNTVVKSFSLNYPSDVAYDSTDNKAYCTQDSTNSLVVVDGVTQSHIKSLPIRGSATIPVWDPVSDRLYVSCQNTDEVAVVVDCTIDSLLMYIPVGACPLKMYINTLRRKLYVLDHDDGTVSVVNMTTNHVIKTVTVGGTPNAGYYCRSADKFYSAGTWGQCIVIDGAADTVVARILLPGGGVDIIGATGNDDAGLVYLGASQVVPDYVATVRAQNDCLLANTTIGVDPYGIACYGKSGLVYCASAGTNEACVLSGDGARVIATLPVGAGPYVFAIVPRHNRLYLGHLSGSYVYVLRDTSAAIAETPSRPPRFSRFLFLSATPNPFSQGVTVAWNHPVQGASVVRLYAQDGRLVRQVRIPTGVSRWVWDGLDDSGATLTPGVYVLETGPGVCANVVKLK